MTELAHEYSEKSISTLLPDRNHTDIPQGVQFFLSLCEAATISHRYQDWYLEEPQTYFCEGVVDYWWDEELVEPTWEMLFRQDLSGELHGMPPHSRFCYQQGAIVGYQLREEYGTTE